MQLGGEKILTSAIGSVAYSTKKCIIIQQSSVLGSSPQCITMWNMQHHVLGASSQCIGCHAGVQCWDLRPANACGPLVPPEAAMIIPRDYVWTWSCNPVLKAKSEKSWAQVQSPSLWRVSRLQQGIQWRDCGLCCSSETGLASPEGPTDYLMLAFVFR